MDIGVYPLPEEEWVLGKSGLKALQYMGVGVPVVASRIGAACEFIRDGENGFLAGSHEEWIDRITRLIADPALRESMGLAGRATVEAGFSVRQTAPVYLQVIDSVLEHSERAVRQSRAPAQA
jgi:glycosyltransferase involved in cell wall biosynthesis